MDPFPIPADYDEIDALRQRDDISLCWSHYMCEPWSPDVYHVCGECFHVFPMAEDLLREHNAVLAGLGSERRETDAEKVWICPHCIHDF